DGQVVRAPGGLAGPPQRRVQRAGAVTALAADRLLVEGDAVHRAIDPLEAPGVTDQAAGQDGALEPPVPWRIVAGREPALFPGRVPGDRRLVQEAVDLDQVAAGEVPRADEVADRHVDPADLLALGRAHDFLMAQPAGGAINAIRVPGGRVLESAVGRLGVGVQVGQGPAVRGEQVRLVVRAVTFGTGIDADVLGVRPRIEIGT